MFYWVAHIRLRTMVRMATCVSWHLHISWDQRLVYDPDCGQ